MNLVIPMAGFGKRFADRGYSLPKPLIPVKGLPMYWWAVSAMPFDSASRVIFIILDQHETDHGLEGDIRNRFKRYDPIVIRLPGVTAGQAVTVLKARQYIDNNEPLVVHNADTGLRISSPWWEEALRRNLDGALLTFKSTEKRWSFAAVGPDGYVTAVTEKVPISNLASTGTYWFRTGAEFVSLASRAYESGTLHGGEYYIAPLYSDLISRGGKVGIFEVDQVLCFGTPEDLEGTLPLL